MTHLSPVSKFSDVKSAILADSPWYVQSNQKISEELLTLGWNWVQSRPITTFQTNKHNRLERQNCKKYIKDNYYSNHPAQVSYFGGFFIGLIINAIISWLVRKLLDSLFD